MSAFILGLSIKCYYTLFQRIQKVNWTKKKLEKATVKVELSCL